MLSLIRPPSLDATRVLVLMVTLILPLITQVLVLMVMLILHPYESSIGSNGNANT